MGSADDEHEDLAVPLGRWLAAFGVHLLNGGGAGVMRAVSRAFHEVSPRSGLVIGVLPGDTGSGLYRGRPGYPNAWIDIAIRTHLPLSGADGDSPASRNHLNVLTPAVVVALPGGPGTRSEVELAVRYRTPLIAWFGTHTVDWPLPGTVRRAGSLADVQRFVRVCVGRVQGG
jgi:uncharacterized protein (TIGR00725 family)